MTLSDRIEWLLTGCVIGFFLGYTVRAIKEMRHLPPSRDEDERGFMRYPIVQDIAIITALALTLFAAFSAARTNNELKHVVACNQVYLKKNLAADTTRSNYLSTRLRANANLQRDQAAFLRVLTSKPQKSKKAQFAATANYLSSLDKFLTVSRQETPLTPYPTAEELQDCLNK